MLIVDMSNLVFGTASDYYRRTGVQCEMNMFRHIILQKLINVKRRLSEYSDEIVIACDSTEYYWRKKIFPHYKAHRAKRKNESDFDWNACFKCFDQLKTELRESFPVTMVEVPGAEADDIIAVLAETFKDKKICIYSSDKDLLQIQSLNPNVVQFSISSNSFVKSDYSLFEHICRGDAGDGIPNFLSDDDTFVIDGKRQRQIRAVSVEDWAKYGIDKPECFCPSAAAMKRWEQNRGLIDLTKIPPEIFRDIEAEYDVESRRSYRQGAVFNYMVKHKLTSIMKNGGF